MTTLHTHIRYDNAGETFTDHIGASRDRPRVGERLKYNDRWWIVENVSWDFDGEMVVLDVEPLKLNVRDSRMPASRTT